VNKPEINNLRVERFILVHGFGFSPSWWGEHGEEQLISWCPGSREKMLASSQALSFSSFYSIWGLQPMG
jgi:hypothetical protein